MLIFERRLSMGGNFKRRTKRFRQGFGRQARSFHQDQSGLKIMTTVWTIAVALLLVGTMAAPLCAQTYPNKPIRLILPMAAGGPTDILGRIIAQKLAERLGQPVVTENRPGAGGNIGVEIAAKAGPDGYTILFTSTALATSPSLYKKLNFDPIKDLAPIALVAESPNVVLIHPSLPVKNLKELAEYAKKRPGKLNFSSGGIGVTTHLAGELFNILANTKIVHVPYKGGGPALIALVGGEVDMQIIGPSVALPQIQAGKVRALAVLSKERLPSLPTVPTAKEAGMDTFEVTSWFGILVPAGTPRDIITRLNAEWVKIAAMPDTKEKMEKAGFEPMSGTPDQFAEFIKAEIMRWATVIKEANISTN
jgi:tripartite-type tricarboxylate transporter receptor subunit TctC